MKLILSSIIILLVIHAFENCTPTTHIQGTYTNTNVYRGLSGEEFRFGGDTSTFEYYSRLEGSISKYSAGTWRSDRKKVLIEGFNDESINLLNVKMGFEDYSQGSADRISVIYQYDAIDTFIKVDLTVNNNYLIRLSKDTTFQISMPITSIQLKSYLMYNGLLPSIPPRVDTLYYPEKQINHTDGHKNITLKFSISMIDFYRDKLADSLKIKNRTTLVFRDREFKKISD